MKTHAIQILESHMRDLGQDGMLPSALAEAIAAMTVIEYILALTKLHSAPKFWKGAEGWGARCGGRLSGPLVGPCPTLLDALVELWAEVQR